MTFVQKLAAILSAISWRQPSVTAKLHERDLWFRQMTEYIREVFFLCNPGMTRTFYVSPGYEDIWGRSCDSLYANPTSFIEGIHVDDRERVLQTMAPHGTRYRSTSKVVSYMRRMARFAGSGAVVYRFAMRAESSTVSPASLRTSRSARPRSM